MRRAVVVARPNTPLARAPPKDDARHSASRRRAAGAVQPRLHNATGASPATREALAWPRSSPSGGVQITTMLLATKRRPGLEWRRTRGRKEVHHSLCVCIMYSYRTVVVTEGQVLSYIPDLCMHDVVTGGTTVRTRGEARALPCCAVCTMCTYIECSYSVSMLAKQL